MKPFFYFKCFLYAQHFPEVKSDCSNLDELPTLYFELDGAEATPK